MAIDRNPKQPAPDRQLPAENSFHGLVAFYNRMYRARGMTLPPHLYPVAQALADTRIRKLMIILAPGSGKLAPYSLEVPTPSGQRRWGDLQPGDHLFGKDGRPTKIVQRHENGVKPIYKVTLDDGTSTLVGLEHNWTVRSRAARRNHPLVWQTLTTAQLIKQGVKLSAEQRRNFELPQNAAVEYDRPKPALDPYLLGVWLGDGCRKTPKFTKDDPDLAEIIRARGYEVLHTSDRDHSSVWWVRGIKHHLQALNLWPRYSYQRFVPLEYKEADYATRLDILRGLLDTDGTPSMKSTAVYCSTSKPLAEDVAWLVRSLGGKARMIGPKIKKFKYKGEMKLGRPAYYVNIVLPNGVNPFYLQRKAQHVHEVQDRYLARWIDRIEYSHDEEAMCVTVDATDHLYLTNDFIVTHNSVLTSIAYPAWLLGLDPAQNILAISAGATLPLDMMAQTRWIIEDNPDYHSIFPETRPDRKKGWTDDGLFVTGHISGVPDASYYATGITSTTVTGKHGTTVILDDIHSAENSKSAESCAKVINSYYETVQGRRDGRGSRVIVVGRRWHPNDLYQHLKNGRNNNFVIMECPAERQGTNLYWDVWLKNENLTCCFNEQKDG